MRPMNSDAPLLAIYGVGERTAERLKDGGYLTVYDVADGDPETMAATVDGVSRDQAIDFVSNARSMIGYWPDNE